MIKYAASILFSSTFLMGGGVPAPFLGENNQTLDKFVNNIKEKNYPSKIDNPLIASELSQQLVTLKAKDTLDIVINLKEPINHTLLSAEQSGEIIYNSPKDIKYKINGKQVSTDQIKKLYNSKKETRKTLDIKKYNDRKILGKEVAKMLHFLPDTAKKQLLEGAKSIELALSKKNIEKIEKIKDIDTKIINIRLPYKTMPHYSPGDDQTPVSDTVADIGVVTFGHNLGKTGEDVKVLLSEGENVPSNTVFNTVDYDLERDHFGFTDVDPVNFGHPSKVVDTFFATAPDAEVVWVQSNRHGWFEVDGSWQNRSDNALLPLPLSNWDPDIVSVSMGGTTPGYDAWPYEWDRQAYENDYILFNSMSNTGDDPDALTTTPGNGYNVITVGAYDQYDNDLICEHENYPPNDPISLGRSTTLLTKPDIVAPGCEYTGVYNNENNRWNGGFGRSSGATPIAAGIMANRLDEIPGIKGHPALAKAFMLATSTTNIDGADLPSSTGEFRSFDGVGAVGMTANYWNSRWWEGAHNSFFDANDQIVFSDYFYTNRTYRLVISWLADPDYALENQRPHMDLDLLVYDGSTRIARSWTAYNNFEVVEITVPTSGYRTIKIDKWSSANQGNLKLGYVRYVK